MAPVFQADYFAHAVTSPKFWSMGEEGAAARPAHCWIRHCNATVPVFYPNCLAVFFYGSGLSTVCCRKSVVNLFISS